MATLPPSYIHLLDTFNRDSRLNASQSPTLATPCICIESPKLV